ncbi:NAD(P)H-hydrate dehydratase [Sphingomonas sp.]|uniref:NAD(P)H-hydrate dehydratase n=1 Tax=Sphingomonas sp. TaxID=28214 RepID=UPI002B9EEE9D|nr:NAD(P)H-hydrate dehydratase [Sphingomonas sp.]HWK34745.1 NAD(P)H-hydrate dehydratase [Sphingomonas sp.]
MTPIEGQPILTAAAMRAAEDRVIAAGTTVGTLMERAGAGVAQAVHRLAGSAPVLILCGPGNNGGDGYVAARVLRERGATVRVAALAEPRTEAAAAARAGWTGPVDAFPDDSAYSPVVVDAVFGTGLSRPVEPAAMRAIDALVQTARLSIAVDLPSGVDTDTGAEINRFQIPQFTHTLALGALKPAHLLQPAAAACGTTRLVDIGLDLDLTASPRDNVSADETIGRPRMRPPQPWMHKFSRGMVAVIGGAMPGASALAVQAAMRAGAGYGLLLTNAPVEVAHAVVQRPWSSETLSAAIAGKRNVAVVVGPGLGRDAGATPRLEAAIATERPLVIDGDALHLLRDRHFDLFRARAAAGDRDPRVVLTPHEGEFQALFGDWSGSKIDAARDAARRSGAIVVFKGPDTVVAHPNGHTNTALPVSAWLSTAGTGDVLAGIIGATVAAGAFDAVEAAVWMHGEAARRLGGAFIADDLVRALSAVRAAL